MAASSRLMLGIYRYIHLQLLPRPDAASQRPTTQTTTETRPRHVMDYNARKQETVRAIYDRLFRAAGIL